MIIEGAVRELKTPQELPNLVIRPVEDRKHSVEVWPSRTALANGFQVP